MVFDRPSHKSPNPTQRPKQNQTTRGGNRGNDGRPSPWLGHPSDETPNPDPTASFVEYLRWMRSPDSPQKDPTKTEILTKGEAGNYSQRLKVLTDRTRQLAGCENCIEVTCPWRIRVGGHRGPESILLPAFDALGIPYIPSSTLRGVARAQALRELKSETEVAKYFGSLEAEPGDRAGKIIFFDAYPLPQQKNGGLTLDIANNLWKWKDDTVTYAANPNLFFSLKECTFLIGLRLASHCSPSETSLLSQVQQWLIQGLEAGIGSQVNTGYGCLLTPNQSISTGFLTVSFSLRGQLIHGVKYSGSNVPEAEVRSVAFKSLLRYWLRAIALGVLRPNKVKELEHKIFGGIEPATHGYVKVRVIETESRIGDKNRAGQQRGKLILSLSDAVLADEEEITQSLLKSLTWLMFHLGGIGQGARRPCYQRRSNPYFRGSTFTVNEDADFWEAPATGREFRSLLQSHLRCVYRAIANLEKESIDPQSPQLMSVGTVTHDTWWNALDRNCRIVVCAGNNRGEKPYGLSLLHDPSLKPNGAYDKNLCGSTNNPSPVWVSDLGAYQVITIFGVNRDPRLKFLKFLQGKCLQAFPWSSG